MHQYLAKSTFVALWFIWLELYWFNVVIGMFLFFIFLSILDVMMGFLIARTYGVVGSKEWTTWLYNKAIRWLLLSWIIAFVANMSYAIQHEPIQHEPIQIALSIWIIIMLGARIVFELVSVIENLSIISDKRESEALTWLSGILMKLVGIGRKKIEQKIDKYTLYQDKQDV